MFDLNRNPDWIKQKSNVPKNYICPICLGVKAIVSDDTLMRPSDIVFQDDIATVLINSFFVGNNPGHVIVVPNEHYENIYTLPSEVGHRIFDLTRRMSLILKVAYNCDGITTRQNNEPAGDQHAFHYHHHVFPRYKNDSFNSVQPNDKRLAPVDERAEYAKKLRAFLDKH